MLNLWPLTDFWLDASGCRPDSQNSAKVKCGLAYATGSAAWRSGMLVINPPWVLDERLSQMMNDLERQRVWLGANRMDWFGSE